MDKLIGKLTAELDRQKLRGKTLVVFAGDNGTGGWLATIGGRKAYAQRPSIDAPCKIPVARHGTLLPDCRIGNAVGSILKHPCEKQCDRERILYSIGWFFRIQGVAR
jgi:hypothetical protein